MIDRDIILQKINSIQNYLTTINTAIDGDLEKLNNQIIQDAVVLNLQRAVQLCMAMGAHIITSLHWGLATNVRDIFVILKQHDVIDGKMTDKMAKMVGFRNIAVHEYQKLNLEILKKIIASHLSDFAQFYGAVLQYCDQRA